MIAPTFPKWVTDFTANAVSVLFSSERDDYLVVLLMLKNTEAISKQQHIYPLHKIGTSPLFLCLLNILSEINGNQ